MGERSGGEQRMTSVDRALDVLEALGRCGSGRTLSELSRELRMPVSSAHDVLAILSARGYVARGPGSRRYVLAPQALWSGSVTAAAGDLRQACLSHVRELARRVSLPVTVSTRIADEGMFVLRAAGQAGDKDSCVGRHFELHCTAQGKALIAWLADSEVEQVLRRQSLLRFTARTIVRAQELRTELAKIRRCGFAVNNEEQAPGVRAIAAPVFGSERTVVASIAIGGWTRRSMAELEALAAEVTRAAGDVSRALQVA